MALARRLALTEGDPDEVVSLYGWWAAHDIYDRSPRRWISGSDGPRWQKFTRRARELLIAADFAQTERLEEKR